MWIYHTPDGDISYTVVPSPHAILPSGDAVWSDEEIHDIDAYHVVDGIVQLREAVTDQLRDRALVAIEKLRTVKRSSYVTDGAGQDMVYLQKKEEAEALLADPDPDPAEYPQLAAEIGLTADTLVNVAQVVLGLRSFWLPISARIERAYYQAKSDIEQAVTSAAVETAVRVMEESLADV